MSRYEIVSRMNEMQERGISFEEIAEYLVQNYLPTSEALDALESLAVDNDFTFEEEEEEEEETICQKCGVSLDSDDEFCDGCSDKHHEDCPAVDGFNCHCDGENLDDDYLELMQENEA